MKYSNTELLIQAYVESKNNELSFQERNLVEQAHFENQNLQIIIQKRVDMILLEECEELLCGIMKYNNSRKEKNVFSLRKLKQQRRKIMAEYSYKEVIINPTSEEAKN